MSAAAFDATGATVLVDLDGASDLGGFQLGEVVPCDALLAFEGADAATCYFVNRSRVAALVSGAAAFLPGGVVSPVGAVCVEGCACDGDAVGSSAVAAAPAAPQVPEAVVAGPQVLSACGGDGAVLDGSQSTGSGGRALAYAWTAAFVGDCAEAAPSASNGSSLVLVGVAAVGRASGGTSSCRTFR